jgi:hypothetical protein
MAKAKTRKTSLSNLKAKAAVAANSDEVEVILEEILKYVDQGAKWKSIATDGREALKDDLRPRIAKKLLNGGDWAKEKPRPLLAASHVGEIAAILTVGSVISRPIVVLAYMLVKNTDEACKGAGSSGAGDWCA